MTNDISPMTQPTTDYAVEPVAEAPKLEAPQAVPSLTAPTAKKDYALITGASSGIGEAFARELAAKGKPLILMGRNEAKLKTLAAELRANFNIDARFIVNNLARSKDLPQLPDKLAKAGLNVDVLINSAGFGKYGPEMEIGYEDSLNMVNLNCRSLLAMCKLFAPRMEKRKKGAIINVASMMGFFPYPKMATYAATKAFVINFSEALSAELKDSGVKVLCVAPGPTSTNFFKEAGMKEDGFQGMAMDDPKDVAVKSIEALKQGKTLLVTGKTSILTKLAMQWLPRAVLKSLTLKR